VTLPPFLRTPARRRAVLFLALLGAVVVLGWGSRGLSSAVSRRTLPTGAAEWIWTPVGRYEQAPVAFLLVRDFEVGPVPARARLLITADEEYVVTLNARRIGAGAWRPGVADRGLVRSTPLDVYEVGPLLLPGGNRLVVEVRSSRTAGGLLARLEDGAGRPLVVSDGGWRIVRRDQPGLTLGWLPVAPPGTSEPVFSWGLPPYGRWGKPVPGPLRPLAGGPSVPQLLPVARPAPGPVGNERLAPQAVFDWGGEVVGRLILEVAPSDERRTALLFTGAGPAPPDPLAAALASDNSAVVVLPGSREWRDVRPRRLRFARILGLDGLVSARIDPLPAAEAGAVPVAPTPPVGVLGLRPPPLRTPVEDEVWRKLERVPDVARGEEL
jgi:hypothetical protein